MELGTSLVIEHYRGLIMNGEGSADGQTFSYQKIPRQAQTHLKLPMCDIKGSIKLIWLSARGRLAHHLSRE